MRLNFAGWFVICLCGFATCQAAAADVKLIGRGRLAGTATDHSGQSEALVNGTPHHRFGGISALEYAGDKNRFFALADRGPDDGATGYQCRFHELNIDFDENGTRPADISIVSTTLLSDVSGRPMTGNATVYAPTDKLAGRFDPEGIRLTKNNTLLISDEYGPHVMEFSLSGKEQRRFPLPAYFSALHPGDSKAAENKLNHSGRSSNRGLEGLALTPDGQFAYGIFQGPLLQDASRTKKGKPFGRNCRIVKLDTHTGETWEYVYQLDDVDHGLNEILALNDHQFLVIERDGETGDEAKFKRIMQIDLTATTAIDGSKALPKNGLPSNITPAAKTVFIDLLDPQFGLAGSSMPKKIEGLSHGPRLADGRQTLVIASDNDFQADVPTLFWVFAY
ncbi:esterase-like activity of phytase family protein [Symmachiella dynata]|uniref:esterase-like activity of phytase family protein n=1 Tax=Symmachiella dynata TaxID=2527995 RepID=UPI0030EC9886